MYPVVPNSPPWTKRSVFEETEIRLRRTSRRDGSSDGLLIDTTGIFLLSLLEMSITVLISISQLPITNTEIAAMHHLDDSVDED